MNEALLQVEKAVNEELKKHTALQFQIEYLRSNLKPENMKPAHGFLRDRQKESLALAKEVITTLQNAHFHPILSGHSLLGAVRHKGFIPWESNMQFVLMAQDFWKLEAFVKKELASSKNQSTCDEPYQIKHNFTWFDSANTKKKEIEELRKSIVNQSIEQHKTPSTALQTQAKKQGQKINPQDKAKNDLTERITHMSIDIEANALVKFQLDPFDYFTSLETALQEHNNIFAMRTPYSIVFYKGVSIETAVRVEFVPYYPLEKMEDIRALKAQAKVMNDLIQKAKSYSMIFHVYDELVQEMMQNQSAVSCKQYYAGINNHAFLKANSNYHDEDRSEHTFPIFAKEDFFPLQNIQFENETFVTFKNKERYLTTLYGKYMVLPKYIGISPYYVSLNVWLRDNKRRLLPISEATLI